GAGVVKKAFEEPQSVPHIVAQVIRKSGEEDRPDEIFRLRNLEGRTVAGGSAPAGRGEKFVLDRIENGARDHRSIPGEGDGDAEERIVVGEVRGSVERVD